jgi:2'-5' RNA ligase
LRVFLALWPGEAVQAALEAEARAMAAEFGGRAIPAAKIHLTLVFLGELDAARSVAAVECARAVEWAPFRVRLDRWGSFRRSKVGWAGSSRVAPGLASLQSQLEERLRREGFVLEDRPFAPHVTLVRKLERAVAGRDMAPQQWEAESLALVLTEPGSGDYRTLCEVAAAR